MIRVTLRPLTEEDVPLIEPWYGELPDAAGELFAIVLPDAGPIGILDCRLDEPAEGWLTIGVIAVAADERGRGYGAEAVRLLEARTGAGSFLANVNPRNGLSLYFWLRQGYRPARRDEVFWRAPEENVMSMVRRGDG